jgi:hypothetical protein
MASIGEDRMGMIEDLAEAMKKVPWLKRLAETPDKLEDLERRLTAIEEKLGDTIPPEFCQRCGALASRLGYSSVEGNVVRQRWDCGECQESSWVGQRVR